MNKSFIKKLFLAVMAIVLIIGAMMVTNVSAASEYTIKITKKANDKVDHKYEAYQIFAGDLYVKTPDDKTLSNITWGNGITDGTNLLNALKDDETIGSLFTSCDSAKAVAVVLEKFPNDEANIKAFAEVVSGFLNEAEAKKATTVAGEYQITVTDPGYYLIKDQDDSLEGSDAAYTRYVLEVVGNVTINPKSEKPTVKKSLSATSDEDMGDYAINKEFNFYLTAKLPASEEYSEYKTYKLVFEDTMDDGITYDRIDSVKVKAKSLDVEPTEKEITLNLTSDYITDGTEGQTLKITITDLADILTKNSADITKGVDVVVTYTAHLNENAKISKQTPATEGNKPNVNTVKLQYSNNPNKIGEDSMGTTVEYKTYVFTYEVDNTKYANEKNPDNILPGAKFKLYKGTEKTEEIKLKWDTGLNAYRPIKETEEADATDMVSQEDTGKFNIVGLDAGTYTLVEVGTPEGYNTCDDLKIVINPSFSKTADSATVTFTGSNMENDVINIHGSKLPTTGSITLIIICGVAIVLGVSGIILSRKKKEE